MRQNLDKILKFKVTTIGQSSNQGHIMIFHTYNPKLMSQPSINFLHLKVSEI